MRDEPTVRQAIEIINPFLEPRGLRLSETKTKITHICDGFDFLGWNFCKCRNGKLIIKPSVKKEILCKDGIRNIFHTLIGWPSWTQILILMVTILKTKLNGQKNGNVRRIAKQLLRS